MDFVDFVVLIFSIAFLVIAVSCLLIIWLNIITLADVNQRNAMLREENEKLASPFSAVWLKTPSAKTGGIDIALSH